MRYDRIAAQFRDDPSPLDLPPVRGDGAFGVWLTNNVTAHRVAGHASVTVSLKDYGAIPGDATAEQMRTVAGLADRHSGGEVRVTHRQNLVLPTVRTDRLREIHDALATVGLAAGNVGLTSDIIACPGLDYCALATARSIPIAQGLSTMLREREGRDGGATGAPTLNISGCINACGHHHAANIGILGLNRAEVENYQITLGGRADGGARVGEIVGPGFSADDVPGAVETILATWDRERRPDESFADTYARVGRAPFKAALYDGPAGANDGGRRDVAA